MDSLKITYIVTFLAVVAVAFFALNSPKNFKSDSPLNVATTTVSQTVTSTSYKNSKYGFMVSLPLGWKGYTIFSEDWEGSEITTDGGESVISERGPLFYIRHPEWTDANPRQDIPIMIFTLKQWADLQTDKFHIGAAPVNPTELSRNAKYVFALPARYNFSYLPGYEEVDRIVTNGGIKGF